MRANISSFPPRVWELGTRRQNDSQNQLTHYNVELQQRLTSIS